MLTLRIMHNRNTYNIVEWVQLNGLYVAAASAVFQGAVIGLSSVFSINYPQGVMAGMVGTRCTHS